MRWKLSKCIKEVTEKIVRGNMLKIILFLPTSNICNIRMTVKFKNIITLEHLFVHCLYIVNFQRVSIQLFCEEP